MSSEAVLTAVVVVVTLVALARELAPPAGVVVGGVVALVLLGVLDAERAFAGLANPATLTIAGLFVVSRALRQHGRLETLVARLLGEGDGGERGALLRLVPTVALVSGVMNNTPLVATVAPLVRDWAERRGLAASRLLIPVSFASILGGLLTLIGTGPTLIVSSALVASGRAGFEFLTVGAVGLPLLLVAGPIVALLGARVLPDRRDRAERIAADRRDYTVLMAVARGGPSDGRTVSEAGLRSLPGTFVAGLVRDGEELAPVAPATRLKGGDELGLGGGAEVIAALLTHPGLVAGERAQVRLLDGERHRLVECVLGSSSPLVGTTLKALSFRGRYGGAVVSIHRAGERLVGRLGQVPLRQGDVLLVLADPGFAERWRGEPDFGAVIALEDGGPGPADARTRLTLFTFAAMVAAAASGIVPVVTAVLGACAVLVGTRTVSFRRALDAVDRDVILIVAGAIGFAQALTASGLSATLAGTAVTLSDGAGLVGALAVIVVATMVLTELVTNVAAAALMAPIAIDLAERTGADPTGFAVAVAIAASASFLTPIGYQTNTLVYGLGRYRFGDYWRLGLPVALATLVTTLAVVPRVWG